MLGASFLQVFSHQLVLLRWLGIQVVLYGDQTGLVGLTAINRSLTVSQNVDDVLASIPGIHGKLNLNDEGLLPVLAA